MHLFSGIPRETLRKQMQAKRKALSLCEQKRAAKKVLARFSESQSVKNAQSIALYLSFHGELETDSFIEYCWAQKKTVYLPVIHPLCKGHLLFLKYDSDSPLVKNQFGIFEPKLDIRFVLPTSKIDLICTPLVAFDALGQRLGMGGGYYDRTLTPLLFKHFYNEPVPRTLGLAYDCQQLPFLLETQTWDVPLCEILTPSKQWVWFD